MKKFLKVVALTLAVSILHGAFFPTISFALTQGPAQPEFSSFEPADATDMVQLLTGDFTYNIPVLNVPSPEGGYPLSLSYHAGISPEQEASWAGLGWNINPGAINRQAKGNPDDWKDQVSSVLQYNSGSIEKDYEASIGYGFSDMFGAGLSVDWGTYKSVGFNTNLIMGMKGGASVGVSAGTHGVGLTTGIGSAAGSANVGVRLDYSGNVMGSAGISSSRGLSSMGVQFSSSGFSSYASLANNKIGFGGSAIGGNDVHIFTYSYGMIIPTPIGVTVGFKYNMHRIWLWKKEEKINYGSLYLNEGLNSSYLASNKLLDSYTNPYSSSTYDDFGNDAASNTLTFPNYDQYMVSAQGLTGSMSPHIYQFGSLSGDEATFEKWPSGNPKKQVSYGHRDYGNGKGLFSKPSQNIYFNFDGEPCSYLNVGESQFSWYNNADPLTGHSNTGGDFSTGSIIDDANYKPSSKRPGGAKYVEWFKNSDIVNNFDSCVSKGFIESESQAGLRGVTNASGENVYYDPNGIGAFSITAEDGKTYHYSIPVYQYEEFYFNEDIAKPDEKYVENRKLNKYAFNWLLTAITGPDYVDNGTPGIIDDSDYGYWVKFDYGKWSDGYLWRTPFNDSPYVNEKDGQRSYSFGRKQIYYLNTIKTKTHTAYFIKEKREDSKGKVIMKPGNPKRRTAIDKKKLVNPEDVCPGTPLYFYEPTEFNVDISETEEMFSVNPTLTLRLDKIILLENAEASTLNISAITGNDPALASSTGWVKRTEIYTLTETTNGGNYRGYACYDRYNREFRTHFEENVLDQKDIESNLAVIESKAIKVIDFNYGYSLCPGTPNSSAPGQEKLTLNSLKTYSKGKKDIFPPYVFSYKTPSTAYDVTKMDYWGYYSPVKNDLANKPNADTWSLNKIETPSGGILNIEYEPDTYYKEAVFNTTEETYKINSLTRLNNAEIEITLNPTDLLSISDWQDWFTPNNHYKLDFKIIVEDQGNIGYFPAEINLKVKSIDNNKLKLECSDSELDVAEFYSGVIKGRGGIAKGGGIRVKSIKVEDEIGNKYETAYNYNHPKRLKTSGITTFKPTDESRYIPYVYEIPGPMVMYEYVTVEEKGLTSTPNVKTRYHFDVIDPVTSTGNEFKMGEHFSVNTLVGTPLGGGNFYNHGNTDNTNISYVNGRSSLVTDNKASIGRLLSVETLNKDNLASESVTYEYLPADYTRQISNGIKQETFTQLKAVTTWPTDNLIPIVNHWFLTSSTRKTYPNLLKKVTKNSNGIKTSVTYNSFDLISGQVLSTTQRDASGKEVTQVITPANSKYPAMGSKVANGANKNMLVQEASSYTYVNNKLIDAMVQTWGGTWDYRELVGSSYSDQPTNKDVWRKKDSYVWKSLNESDGAVASNVFKDYWQYPADAGWQKTSEVVQYDHFSKPIKVKDINGKMAVSKYGYDGKFLLASAHNIGYTSFAYSGAEDPVTNADFFGGEVSGGSRYFNSTIYAHTGNGCVMLTANQEGFKHTGIIGTDIKKGEKYIAKAWVHSESSPNANLYYQLQNANGTLASGSINKGAASAKKFGKWYLLELIIDVPLITSATTLVVGTSNPGTGALTSYFDDFKFQPVSVVVTGTVYDEVGNVIAVLNNDNIATKMVYDAANRLTHTYKETADGFKLVSSTKYNMGKNGSNELLIE